MESPANIIPENSQLEFSLEMPKPLVYFPSAFSGNSYAGVIDSIPWHPWGLSPETQLQLELWQLALEVFQLQHVEAERRRQYVWAGEVPNRESLLETLVSHLRCGHKKTVRRVSQLEFWNLRWGKVTVCFRRSERKIRLLSEDPVFFKDFKHLIRWEHFTNIADKEMGAEIRGKRFNSLEETTTWKDYWPLVLRSSWPK